MIPGRQKRPYRTVTLPDGLTALRRSHRAADPVKHTHTCTKAVAARETRLLEPAGQLGARHPRRGPRAGPSPTASWRGPAAILSPRSAAPTAFPPSPRPRSAVMYLCLLVTVEEIPQFDSSGHASLPESIVSPSSNTTELRGSAPGFVGSKPPSQYERERTQHTARSADRDLAAAGRALRRAGDALDPGRSPRCCVGAGTDAPTRPATRTGDRPRRSERA